MQVDVHLDAIALGNAKDNIQMAHRVAIHHRRVETANAISAQFHRFFQQFHRTGAHQHAALGESNHLHGHSIFVFVARRQHAFDVGQTSVGVHIDMGADMGDAGSKRGPHFPRRLGAGGET